MSIQPILKFDLPEAVVITGTASGLGESIATLLNDSNVQVIGVDISQPNETLKSLNHYAHVQGDITNSETWSNVKSLLANSNYKRVGLVTCAAIVDVGSILEADKTDIDRIININIMGTILAIQSVLPHMIKNKNGSIVIVGSVSSVFAEQQLSLYGATKAAVTHLARTIALDHAREGIKANIVHPGPMMTPMFKHHIETAEDPDLFYNTRAKRQPYGTILEPVDVAKSAVFLLSSGSDALCGTSIMADGGLSTGFDFRTGEEGTSI